MPDEEHNLTIRIETNAAQAAEEMERLDAAQQNASNSGSKLEETERRGSSAEARRIRLRAKYMRAYIRDIKAIRQNSVKLDKEQRRVGENINAAGFGLKGVAQALGGKNVAMGIMAISAALVAIKKSIDFVGSSAKDAMAYRIGEEATGTDTQTIQALEDIVAKHGGNRDTAIRSIIALQNTMAKIEQGFWPFSKEVETLMGEFLRLRPGASFVEYAGQLGERLQQLTPAQALIAGGGIGLPPEMIMALREGSFAARMQRAREIAPMSPSVPEKAQDVNQRWERSKRDFSAFTDALGVALGDAFLPRKTGIAGVIESLGKIVNPVEHIKTNTDALGNFLELMGLGKFKKALPQPSSTEYYNRYKAPGTPPEERSKALEMLKWENLMRGFGQFSTNTPLNYMPPSTAFAMGMRAGAGAAGDKVLNLGGITINTTSDDPQEIAERVAGAGRIVLDEFARLDRLQAGEYYA